MTPPTTASPFLIDEIVLIDALALFLAVATVSILWYVVKKIFRGEVKAGDETTFHRIACRSGDDRNRCGCVLGRAGHFFAANSDDDRNFSSDQIVGERR